jgi:hypothetical protein
MQLIFKLRFLMGAWFFHSKNCLRRESNLTPLSGANNENV